MPTQSLDPILERRAQAIALFSAWLHSAENHNYQRAQEYAEELDMLGVRVRHYRRPPKAINAFVRDCCEIDPNKRIYVNDLYAAWEKWRQASSFAAYITRQTFGRDLAAAVPGVVCRQNHMHGRFYEGLGLRSLHDGTDSGNRGPATAG